MKASGSYRGNQAQEICILTSSPGYSDTRLSLKTTARCDLYPCPSNTWQYLGLSKYGKRGGGASGIQWVGDGNTIVVCRNTYYNVLHNPLQQKFMWSQMAIGLRLRNSSLGDGRIRKLKSRGSLGNVAEQNLLLALTALLPAYLCTVQHGSHQLHLAVEHLKCGWSELRWVTNKSRQKNVKYLSDVLY